MKGNIAMKKRTILALGAMLLAVLLCFSGCAKLLQGMENPEVREDTCAMLDALLADDLDAAYALVSQVSTREEFVPVYEQWKEFLGDGAEYELNLLSYYTNTSVNGGKRTDTVQAVYDMTTETERTIVAVVVDSQLGLTGFQVAPYEQTNYYYTGLLGHMKDADMAQWGMLLSNILLIGVGVVALVDCCRHSMKKKSLWITVLILGFMTVSIKTAASSFGLHFNFGWLLNYAALVRYGGGTTIFRVLVPAGAIAYFIARPRLLKKETAETIVENEM